MRRPSGGLIHSLSIVFPAYNDAGTIASMIVSARRTARKLTDDFEILVVDDEPKVARLARDYLEKNGFRVLTAGDGQSALTTARREKPDLIVLDVMMPDKDGYAVCKDLKADPALRKIPILLFIYMR